MKYQVGQHLVRTKTNQKFTIKKKTGFKKINSFRFERVYELRGPHPSLDLIVSTSDLDKYFIVTD